MNRGALITAVVGLLLLPGAAAGGNPWQPNCKATPSEQSLPTALQPAARAFFPWVPKPKALRAGPLYLVALSTRTAISRDGDQLDSDSYYLHRALVAIAPGYRDTVTIRGQRIGRRGGRTQLGFSTSGATRCTVHAPVVSCGTRPLRFADKLIVPAGHGWRIVRTELRIGRTGCFQLTATGPNLHKTIALAVPGPDYGTNGW